MESTGTFAVVPTVHCAGRRGLNLLAAVRPVGLAHGRLQTRGSVVFSLLYQENVMAFWCSGDIIVLCVFWASEPYLPVEPKPSQYYVLLLSNEWDQ